MPPPLSRSVQFFLIATALLFAGAPLAILWRGLTFLYVLAILPGCVAVAYQLVSAPARRERGRRLIARYAEIRDKAFKLHGPHDAIESDDDSTSTLSACCSAAFLTGVFLLVAVIADRYLNARDGPATAGMQGIVFCGVGAYVAVLYYMTARLYANALSSRFITTSALRTASALAVGWIAAMSGLDDVLPDSTTRGALFLIGLFYNWAIVAIRNKALSWLGAPKSDNDELPLTIVEGIDDTAADLLLEYGVSTLQHLVEADPAELSERTLIPINRILEWLDQAMLIQRVKRNIVNLRTVGVRTATDLARIHAHARSGESSATDLQKSLSERTALGMPALLTISGEFESNLMLNVVYQALDGKTLTPPCGGLRAIS